MTSVRLLALDLDGTLLRSDGSISERTRQCLRRAGQAGITVLCVTARPPRRMLDVAAAVGLTGFAICSNGGVVYDLVNECLIEQVVIPADIASEIVRGLRLAVPGVHFAVEAGLTYGCEAGYIIAPEHARDSEDPSMVRLDALALCELGVTKLIVQHSMASLDDLLVVTRQHAGAFATVTHSGSQFVEVGAAGVTKALALEAFCTERKIDAAEVIAFGDMPNDLPMLLWAGSGVAVANAHQDVLDAADEVTLSNDEDGVADYVERLALGNYAI